MDELQSLNVRPLLADRLQLIFSPNYSLIDIIDEQLYYDILRSYFNKDVQRDLNVKIERHGYTRLLSLSPQFVGEPENMYFKHVRVSLNKPFSITTEFNFIRYLKDTIKDESSFQVDYDKSIIVNETNYLNNETWTNWDLGLIKRLRDDIHKMFYWFACGIWDAVIPDNTLLLKHTGLSHAEFNREYYVGSGNSLDVINHLQQFFISDRGKSWMHELGMLGVNIYGASPKFSVKPSLINTNNGQTFKFYMGKGIWFKIYRKTKDHIRAEVGFENSFIKRKYKTRSYARVFTRLRALGHETIKKANIEGIIHLAMSTAAAPLPAADRVQRPSEAFLNRLFTGGCLSALCKQIDAKTPISDPALLSLIRSIPNINSQMGKTVLENANKPVYFYDPYQRIRKQHVNSFLVDPIFRIK